MISISSYTLYPLFYLYIIYYTFGNIIAKHLNTHYVRLQTYLTPPRPPHSQTYLTPPRPPHSQTYLTPPRPPHSQTYLTPPRSTPLSDLSDPAYRTV